MLVSGEPIEPRETTEPREHPEAGEPAEPEEISKPEGSSESEETPETAEPPETTEVSATAESGEPAQSLVISEARFDELVSEALDSIPPELAEAMDNVAVLVEEEHPEEPDLLGLYEGVALTERTHDYGFVLPDRITIYRRPIVAMCADERDVVHEVLVTVVHEVAHHFGLDEDTLHRLGWG